MQQDFVKENTLSEKLFRIFVLL